MRPHREKKKKALLFPRQVPDRQIIRYEEYRATDKPVKKSVRNDQRNLTERKVAGAEEAAKKDDSRPVYKISNEIIGKNSSIQHGLVKDPLGILMTEERSDDNRERSLG